MKISKELVHRFKIGDPITDKELEELLKFYTDLEQSLNCLGREFALAWKPVLEDRRTLEDYKRARSQK